jgi:hypothetical protein
VAIRALRDIGATAHFWHGRTRKRKAPALPIASAQSLV